MTITARPAFAAVAGSLFLLPFFAANAIVGNRIEPFFSLIRPGLHTSPRDVRSVRLQPDRNHRSAGRVVIIEAC
jgi:hypothetical protein